MRRDWEPKAGKVFADTTAERFEEQFFANPKELERQTAGMVVYGRSWCAVHRASLTVPLADNIVRVPHGWTQGARGTGTGHR